MRSDWRDGLHIKANRGLRIFRFHTLQRIQIYSYRQARAEGGDALFFLALWFGKLQVASRQSE
jgi:hypothetical protein